MSKTGLAECLVYVYGSISVRTRSDEKKRVPGAIWLHTIWSVYDLWQIHSTESRETRGLVPLGVGIIMEVPSDMVYGLERHAAKRR